VCQLKAQQLFLEKTEETYVIGGRSTELTTEERSILQQLAEGQSRPFSSVEFNITYQQTKKVVRNSTVRITSSVEASDFRITGDIFYKGFDISEVLIPSEMSFDYALQSLTNKLVVSSGNGRVKILNRSSSVFTTVNTDSLTNQWRIDLSKQKFYYSSNAVKTINERIALVKEYYVASLQMEQLHLKLSTVNPTDLERLDMHNAALINIEYSIGQLESRNFENILNLPLYDPLRYTQRLETLKKETYIRRQAMNEVKSTLYLHFYNMALDMQARGKVQMAKDYFMRSLRENPQFAPSAYQMALISYREGNYERADDFGTDIIKCMNPDPDIHRLTIELLNDVYEKLLKEAEQLSSQKKYADALLALDKARNLCQSINGVQCNDQLGLGYNKAHNGIYQAKLDMARKAYQENNLSKAEGIVQDALRYRDRHANEITNAEDALSMLKAIRQKRYENIIENGRTQINQQQYDKALQSFKEADGLMKSYSLVQSAYLSGLKKQAAKPVILSKINKGNDFVRLNNMAEARKASRDVLTMQTTYELLDDEDINTRFTVLKQNIFSQECVNAQNQVDGHHKRMQEAINRKDFIEADLLYKEADKILQDFADCSLNSGTLRAEHDSIISGYVYQTLVRESVRLQGNNQMADAVNKYQEAENYFQRYEVSRFGLNHKSQTAIASEKGTDDYLIYLGNYFRGKKDLENSLLCYKTLVSRETPQRHFKDDLYQLGIELGLRDKLKYPTTNPKQKILEYTAGNKNLGKLGKGYRKGWKMHS